MNRLLKAIRVMTDVDLSPIQYVQGYETAPDVVFESIQRHVDRYLKESVTGNNKIEPAGRRTSRIKC